MTQSCHHLHESINELVPVILVCWVLACFVFVVWFCVLFGFVLCVFAVCLVYDDDGPMDYVQVLPQFSFAALNSRWPGTLICNYCSCNVIQCGKRPDESHEGVGRKKKRALTDKQSLRLFIQLLAAHH